MKANEHQVGGDHYRKVIGEQLWDRLWRLYGPDRCYVYFIGTIVAYLERYKDKNGIEDLKKAHHYLTKLIELEEEEARKNAQYQQIVDDTNNPDHTESKQ